MSVLFCVDQSFSQVTGSSRYITGESLPMLASTTKTTNVLSGVKGNHIHFMLQVLWLFVPWRTQPQQNQ